MVQIETRIAPKVGTIRLGLVRPVPASSKARLHKLVDAWAADDSDARPMISPDPPPSAHPSRLT